MSTVGHHADTGAVNDLPPLYTVADLCAWLGIESERYVRDRVVKEDWPHIFIDRKHRFTAEHLVAIRDMHARGKKVTSSGPAFGGQITRGGKRSA